MTVGKLVKLFLKHNERLAASGERSEKTVKFYRSRFKLLTKYFAGRKWKSLTSLEVLDYLEHAGKGRAGTTRRHNAVALTTLQAWAIKQGLAKRRIFKGLEKPPMGRRTFTPTEEQTAALLEHASVHFRLIHAALAQSAARPGEMCQINIDDIHWRRGTHGVIVLKQHKTARKTGKPRIIPMGQKLWAILRTAIGKRATGPVFRTASGKRWDPAHLSSMFRRLRDAAGLPKEYVLYSERHGSATRMLKAIGDIKVVSEIIGHSSVIMTERYTHVAVAELGKFTDVI